MKTRTTLGALAAALLAGGTALAAAAPAAASGDAVTLSYFTFSAAPDHLEDLDAIITAFEAANPNITIEVQTAAYDDYFTSLQTQIAGGSAPDTFELNYENFVSFAASGALLDLESSAPGTVDKAVYFPKAYDAFNYKGVQLGVPESFSVVVLIYNKDLFDKAGLAAPTTYDTIQKAAQALNGKNGVAGITLATAPGSSFTEQTFEYLAQANGCELVDNDKKVTLDSPQCVRTFDFYSNLAKNYSVKGNQTDDSTRATYFAGKAAMIIWSSFILDEMAGLRKDALPSCAECKSAPAFLARNSGIVTSIQGPDGKQPSSFGEIVSFATTTSAPKDSAAKFIEYMMSDAYTQWLGIAPEGKVPTRQGTKPGDTSYLDAWQKLKAGVDTKAPLSEFYAPDVLAAVQKAPETFNRWGLPQGQGALVGAMQGPLPVPKALAGLINGSGDPAAAAQSAQKAVEDLQKSTN